MSHVVKVGPNISRTPFRRATVKRTFLLHKPSRISVIKPRSLVVIESPVSVLLEYQSTGPWFLLPVDLSVLVEILQAFEHVFQHRGYAGLVQDARLVFASRDDVLDHVQHGACKIITTGQWLITRSTMAYIVSLLKTTFSMSERNESYPAVALFRNGGVYEELTDDATASMRKSPRGSLYNFLSLL